MDEKDSEEMPPISLWYDDDGNKLEVGDFVTVNGDQRTMIGEQDNGDRYLKGLPSDLMVDSLEKES